MALGQNDYETYRLSKIPLEVLSKFSIKDWFPENGQTRISNISWATAITSNPHTQGSKMAAITFVGKPEFLSSITPTSDPTPLKKYLPGLEELDSSTSEILIDQSFLGLTPLNDVQQRDDVINIVAVTGLGGRPFGSWQSTDGSLWLRDHLAREMPNSRVLTYGYVSKLLGSGSYATLRSFTHDLLHNLLRLLESGEKPQPILLIGHSLGGIIIKDAWIQCKKKSETIPEYATLLRALDTFVFFGTPHGGLQADALMAAADGQPTETLPRDLTSNSSILKELAADFPTAQRDIQVISCYEQLETSTLKKQDDGKYLRNGPPVLMVSETSACLRWPDEICIPIHGNHSSIAKLGSQEGSCANHVVREIKRLAEKAQDRVDYRFLQADLLIRMEDISNTLATICRQTTVIPSGYRIRLQELKERHRGLQETLEANDLYRALLGTYDLATAFSQDVWQLQNILNPFKSCLKAIKRPSYSGTLVCPLKPRDFLRVSAANVFTDEYIEELLVVASSILITQWGKLLPCMPEELVHSSTETSNDKFGLRAIAAIQSLAEMKDLNPQSALNGTLSPVYGPPAHTAYFTDVAGYRSLVMVEARSCAPYDFNSRFMSDAEKEQIKVAESSTRKLAALLVKLSEAQVDDNGDLKTFGLATSFLRCIGYQEDTSKHMITMLYHVPGQNLEDVIILKQVVEQPMPLEKRFRIALALCSTVMSLHCLGWVHKNIRPDNVILISNNVYLKGFQFSRQDTGLSNPFDPSDENNIYRHPDRQGIQAQHFTKEHDIYSLGLVLLEIGTGYHLSKWKGKVENSLKRDNEPFTPHAYRSRLIHVAETYLSNKMGTKYTNATLKCLRGASAGFQIEEDTQDRTKLALAFQQEVISQIRAGCGP